MPELQFLHAIFNTDFPKALLKLKNWTNFSIFSDLILFYFVFNINGITILFSKHKKIRRWKYWLVSVKPNNITIKENKKIKVKNNIKKISA